MRVRGVLGVAVTVMVGLAGCSGSSPEEAASAPATAPAEETPASNTPLPQGKPFDVAASDMTIHSFHSDPQTKSTSFRLNCYPLWSDVETAKGKYNWPLFDLAIANSRAWGAEVMMYSFCGTPKWAAASAPQDPAVEVFGPGSTAVPKMNDFEDYVRAVVKRYKDDISAWEVWNEASSPQFFQGTPEQMREMTEIVRDVVKEEDPDGLVTMASMQTHRKDYYKGFAEPYMAALAKADWPIDVYNGHFYPFGEAGPAARRAQIAMFRKSLANLNAPDKPLWDTEVNYYTGVPGGEPNGRVTGDRAAAWAVRTYLDGWRLDVRRNYWYFATVEYDAFPGIQTRPGDPATVALATFHDWVIGSRFNGCEPEGDLVNCAFVKNNKVFYVAWGESASGNDTKNVRVSYPLTGPAKVCQLPDNTCKTTSSLTVDEVPVLITPTV